MRWLLHGNLTPAVGEALRRHGHSIEKLDDQPSDASEYLKAASTKQLDVITADSQMAEAPFVNHMRFGRSIVFLQLTGGDVEQDDAIDRLFERYKRLTPGRLYTVTGSRVKIRQLPSAHN